MAEVMDGDLFLEARPLIDWRLWVWRRANAREAPRAWTAAVRQMVEEILVRADRDVGASGYHEHWTKGAEAAHLAALFGRSSCDAEIPGGTPVVYLSRLLDRLATEHERFRRHEEDPDGYGSITLHRVRAEILGLSDRMARLDRPPAKATARPVKSDSSSQRIALPSARR